MTVARPTSEPTDESTDQPVGGPTGGEPSGPLAAPRPLSRNRNYNILWTGQLLSELAFEVAMVAVPLLILAHTGSALQMGVASSVLAAVRMLAAVPAGAIADRWNRRTVMLTCQGLRAVSMGSLAAALALDRYSYWHLLAVVVLEGVLGSVFEPAEHAALPQVVPESQLSTAVARNAARPYVATLLGPSVAGFLFSVHPTDPFTVTAGMLALSAGAMTLLRLPPAARSDTEETGGGMGGEMAAGFRWVLRNRVLRTTLLWMMGTNLVFNALLVIILALSHEDQTAPGEIGLMMACLGAGGLLGAALASWLHRRLPAPVIVLGFAWLAAVATSLMAAVSGGVPLGALLGLAALFAPVANTTVMTHQLLVTPDGMRGRVSSISALCAGGAGALGPLVGGVLVARSGGGTDAVLACGAALALIAVGTTASPVLRRFPRSSGQTHE
ncbi:MFS transporter [Kitasatospora sp. NPDC086791]|uniref:MFS transporter n=1 Tax=Kitasatospora sp. NPDC086791 TaxID=3155178 RepID=UPI003423C851